MIITKKRVRNIDRYTKMIKADTTIRVGVSDTGRFTRQLQQIGFSSARSAGEIILPAIIGSISRYNADGRDIIHRDQPKETLYRQTEWHWKEWHGRDTITQSKIVDVPYERYPRTHVAPPGVELTIFTTTAGGTIVAGPEIQYSDDAKEQLTHTVNLLLEIFGECQFFTADLNQIIQVPIRRLNWHLLPPGQRPWEQLRHDLEPIINLAPEGKRVVIENRLETISKYKPDFHAYGTGGFQGYVVLGFTDRQLYVLESLIYGNATYVLGRGWEEISKLTKAEILQEDWHLHRFIHREGWMNNVNDLLAIREKSEAIA
ncbi:MAG: hypothetical protein ABH846_04420 [Patescibacteria group bacterium]